MSQVDPQSLEGLELSDRVRVTRLRAVGSVGFLYQGELLSLGRPVATCAVKVMHPRPMCSPEALLQDMREQGRYVHPHLMGLQHSGLVREGPARDWVYLAWELADDSIQDLLTRGSTLTPTQIRECLVHILEALRYLHGQGLIHGEIRPPNILLTRTGWKLSGLEYRGTLSRRLEELGFSQNHFVFRAPEAQEKAAEHPSADIWSLAVVAHAALTGRLPFDEEQARDRSDLLWRIMNQEPVVEDLGEPFDMLMTHCLVREPGLRWTAEQALCCMLGEPVQESPHPPLRPLGFDKPEWAASPSVQPSASPPSAAPEVLRAAPPPPEPSQSPVYVLMVLGLLLVGVFIGKFLLPPPPKRVQQVSPDQCQQVKYNVATLDERGRINLQPAQAPVLVEDLGEGVNLELVQVPGGDFDQGSREGEMQREPDESPRHRVRLDNFYLSRFEINQEQWAAVCRMPLVERDLPSHPWETSGGNLPVSGINWDQAREFTLRLSQASKRIHRLPSEAEWEYACRGGPVDAPFHFGEILTDQVANFAPLPAYTQSVPPGMDRGQPVNTQMFPYASHFGLYQMHGNVKEWCLDYYGPYEGGSMSVNPIGPVKGRERVVRGGGYRSPAARCRSAARSHEPPDLVSDDLGFRVVVPEITVLEQP